MIRKLAQLVLPVILVAGAAVVGLPAVPAGAAGTSLLSESFNNATTTSQGWTKPTGSAGVCLTAGTNASATPVADCDGQVGTVSEPVDPAGSGALQLTNNAGSQVGTIYNGVAVPTANGLDISWTSYQFNGNGADGISFDLAAVNPSDPTPPSTTGPSGGSLGYSTDQSNYGVPYGYLGFGADVYGNFENSSFAGSSCTPTTPAKAESLGVRGPGNGTTGYCLLGQTQLTGSLTMDDQSATSRGSGSSSIGVPEEVVLNPSASAITASVSGISVPAGDWLFAVEPLNSDAPGTTWKSLEGALPTNPTSVPTAWLNSTTHLPQELAFGFAASTGGANEFHQINLLQVSSISASPSLALTNTDSGNGVLTAGSTSTVTLTPSVASGSAASESQNVVVTDTFPSSLVPTAASGTGWTCTVTSPSISCTYATGAAITAGTALPAISVTLTTSSTPGAFTDSATATSSDAAPSTTTDAGSIKSTQTVSFSSTAPTGATNGGAPYTMADSSTSGLAVTTTVDAISSGVCSISGAIVSFIGVGTCTLDANQGGNGSYLPATQVQQSFNVTKIPQSITGFSTPPSGATVNGATYSVSATGGASGNPVTYGIDATTSSVCTISAGVVSFIGRGACTIDANQAGNATYSAATPAQQSFAVGVAALSITAGSPTITLGAPFTPSETPSGLLSGNVISGVTYTYSGTGATTYGPSSTAPTAVGTYSVTPSAITFSTGSLSNYAVTYTAGTVTISATNTPGSPITLRFTSVPVGAVSGSPPGTYDVVAVASPNDGTVLYSSATPSVCSVGSSGTLTILAAGTCTIDAKDTGAAGYWAAPQISQSFVVAGPPQTIVFTSVIPAAPKIGGTFTPAATGGGSGNPVIFSLDSSSSGCTYSAATGLVTFTSNTGRCVIDANQAGNASYSAASQVSLKIPASAVVTASLTVYFANNSSLIRSSYQGRLTSLAAAIKADDLTNITVTGYASSTGAHAHNNVLGTERAKAARAYLKSLLVKLNVVQVRITCNGDGASHFVVFPTTNASNRRTTITAT